MKKEIRILVLLSIILLIISSTIIILLGNVYTTTFYVNDNNYELEFEKSTGKVNIIKTIKKDNKYFVTIKSKKPGKVYLKIEHKDYTEMKYLYVHKSMIITYNNYFGYSKGSEIIPISLTILLIYILFILIKKLRQSIKDNIYQYKNVAYLGIIIFDISFILSNLLSIINYSGIIGTIDKILSSMSVLSIFLFPVAFITFLLVTISNIRLLKKEGKTFKNMLGLFLGIFICLSTMLPEFVYRLLMNLQIVDIYNLNSIGPYLYSFVESLVYLVVAYLECVLIGTIIISLKSIRQTVSYDKDYIIILGCKIKKDGSLTPLLKGRVDRAVKFRNEQLKETGKDLVFITSGGKGNDEIISEAEAMKNYLIENGIKEKNIIIEDKSKNTFQNIKYSNKLIKKKNSKVSFCTTNYHVFRAGLLATNQGLKLDGLGSKTKTYFWINAFIREFIGTLYSERKKHIITFIIIVFMIVLMMFISFLANII